MEKKSRVGSITLANFTLNYKAMVIKAVRHWYRNGHTGEWNEHRAALCVQSTTKEARTYSGESTVSSINGAQKTGQTHARK